MIGPRKWAQQQAQEGGDLELGEVGEVEVAVEPEAMAHGTDADGGDGRELVARVAVHQQRGLAARRPGVAHAGTKRKPLELSESIVLKNSFGIVRLRHSER